MSLFRVRVVGLLGLLLVAGCTADRPEPDAPDPTVRTALPDADTTVVEGTTAVELAVGTSQALYLGSPAVVLVGDGDADALPRAVEVTVDLGVPLLVTPAAAEPAPPVAEPAAGPVAGPTAEATPSRTPTGGVLAEIQRLGARALITVGTTAAAWAATPTFPPGVTVVGVDDPVPVAVTPPERLPSLLVLAEGTSVDAAAVATARAAGARVLELGTTDPRATAASVQTIADAVGESAATPTGAGLEDAGSAGAASVGPGSVGAASARAGWTGAGWPGAGWPGKLLALGSAFGPADRLRQRVATAATGVQLPGGGQLVFPGRRMVALYGHPGDPGLGVLGEQPVEAAISRAQQLAGSYQAYVGEPVVPAFEIIVTVATGRTGSRPHPVEKFRPWVQAAREAGVYVVLDLQPGDVHFLEQARLYEELLREPHVGLALDPEWRVQPGKAHMVQIGSVDAAEVNEVGQWLAQLTREHNLPQKVLMLHQFRLDMISNRSALVTDYDELRVVIHADGFGSPGAKYDTWNTLHIDAPANVAWGWKNFYDEDKPTFTPEQTMAVSPEIVFVSYQ
jgi:hypothetical protein